MVEDFQKMKNKALPLPGRVVESTVPPVVFVEDIQDLVQLCLNIVVEDIPMKALTIFGLWSSKLEKFVFDWIFWTPFCFSDEKPAWLKFFNTMFEK